MQLRHISPRSIDWMDAMDEGAGGRGWEKLAPEERTKLLRDRQGEPAGGGTERVEQFVGTSAGARGRLLRERVAFQVGDQDLRRAILRVARVVRVPHVVDEDGEHERQVTGRARESR